MRPPTAQIQMQFPVSLLWRPLRIRVKGSIMEDHLGGSAMNPGPRRTGWNLSHPPAARGAHICVIGAGPSGLTTLKNLLALGLTNAVCFDEADAIGGNWVFREDQPSVHQFTHTISSKRLSEFEDYPMPADFPDFPRTVKSVRILRPTPLDSGWLHSFG